MHFEVVIANIDGPLSYFIKYIPRELFESAATFTNMYAQQIDNRMKPCTADNIETVFDLHIAIGTLAFLSVNILYWNNPLGKNLLLEKITRERFLVCDTIFILLII